MSKFTPGPWRWGINLKSKQVQLCGGVPRFDLIVMDFVRWGMDGAAPRFNTEIRPYHNLMERVEKFAAIQPGREHHADWFQRVNHPDAMLIEAAPDLLAACQLWDQGFVDGDQFDAEQFLAWVDKNRAAARAAIAKATAPAAPPVPPDAKEPRP